MKESYFASWPFIRTAFLSMILMPAATGQHLLSFSSDTVYRETCISTFDPVDTIVMSNGEDHDVFFYWNLIQFDAPVGTSFWHIIEPNQYPPFTSSGQGWILPLQSADVLFYLNIPDPQPGDTAIIQFRFYEFPDTFSTVQILTAILVCPASTGIGQVVQDVSLELWPNPAFSEVDIQLPDDFSQGLIYVYDTFGRLADVITVYSGSNRLYIDKYSPGCYQLALRQENVLKAMSRLIVAN